MTKAEYIYEVFNYSREHDCNDLIVQAVPMLKVEMPIPEGLTEREIDRCIGANYDEFVRSFNTAVDKETCVAEFEEIVKVYDAETAEYEASKENK